MISIWTKIKNFFGYFDLNKDGRVSYEDAEVAAAIAEQKIGQVKVEAKARVARVKEEIVDVKEAVDEVINQVGDVADAAKGKKRAGRKPKK